MRVTGRAPRGAPAGGNGFDVLDDRLGRLERANRRWRRVGAGLGTGLVLLLGAAAAQRPGAVEAEQFVLKDRDGVTRAAWALRPDRTPGLGFFDKDGKTRLSLDLGQDGAPGVNLLGPDGALRAALAIRPDGTPGLCLTDHRGNLRLSLDLGQDGSSGINLYSRSGVLRAALAIRPDGTPGVGLFDEQGAIRRSFEIEPDGGPAPRGGKPAGLNPDRPQDVEPTHPGRYTAVALPAARTVP